MSLCCLADKEAQRLNVTGLLMDAFFSITFGPVLGQNPLIPPEKNVRNTYFGRAVLVLPNMLLTELSGLWISPDLVRAHEHYASSIYC